MMSGKELGELFEEMQRDEERKAYEEKERRLREQASARQRRYAWDHEEAILDEEARRREVE